MYNTGIPIEGGGHMLEQLCMLRDFETRSVCSENKTGEKAWAGARAPKTA